MVKNVDLSHNLLSYVGRDTFQGFFQFLQMMLLIVNLSNNHILSYACISFGSHVQRLIIDLSSNNISILKTRGFKVLKLQGWIPALYLSSTFISEIEINAFDGLNPVVIQLYLILSSNLISHIKKETFCNLAALQTLHLDRNKLIALYSYMFKMLRKLIFFLCTAMK